MNYKKYLPFFISNFLRKLKYHLLLYSNFEKMHGYKLNLNSPRSFNEKIYHRKCFGDKKYLAQFADKVAVRDIVAKTIGSDYLVPLIGVYDRLTADIWAQLPEQFVLKTSHGSGENHIHIVRNKSEANADAVIAKINDSLKEDWGAVTCQPFYSVLKPKILVEEMLGTGDICDYKFHCFNSKTFVQFDMDRFSGHKRCFFDENWNLLKLKMGYDEVESKVERPVHFDQMLKLARRLSNGFNYVRVDLYCVDSKVYFGEVTLAHENGTKRFLPGKIDWEWGEYWGDVT